MKHIFWDETKILVQKTLAKFWIQKRMLGTKTDKKNWVKRKPPGKKNWVKIFLSHKIFALKKIGIKQC